MEGHREGMRVETPRDPSVRWLWDGRATGAVLDFLRDTRVGCMMTTGPPNEGGGSGPPYGCIFIFLLALLPFIL